MRKTVYKYKNDPLEILSRLLLIVVTIYSVAMFRNDKFLPYYLGVLPIFALAVIIVCIWKCKHGAGKELYTWIGTILPLVYTAVCLGFGLTGGRASLSVWVMLLCSIFFLALAITIDRCKDEDTKGLCHLYLAYMTCCFVPFLETCY